MGASDEWDRLELIIIYNTGIIIMYTLHPHVVIAVSCLQAPVAIAIAKST